jgi:histone-lysine N-methyltransferase SETMAR
MQNIMQTSQGLERGMSQISSGETRAQKAPSSIGSTSAHPNMKASRVAMSHQLLEILQHCQATSFVNFLTGDESWFFSEHLHYGVWAAFRDAVSETSMTTMSAEKDMISIIWSISGIRSLLALTKGMKSKSNSQCFCQHVIPDIQQNICSSSRRKTSNHILLHLETASAHNSRLSSKKIESANAQRVPHTPYNPDLAPSHFFLIGSLNEKLSGTSFTTSDDLIVAIRQILS